MAYRVEVDQAVEMETVGLWVDLRKRVVRNTAKRTWRLHAALTQLLRQKRCSGTTLRVVAGHLCHFFMVQRCALSVLGRIWNFIEEKGDCVDDLPADVVNELAVARGLVSSSTLRRGSPRLADLLHE